MGRKKRFEIKHRQRMKRHKRRRMLKAKNLNPNDYFSSGYFVGPKK